MPLERYKQCPTIAVSFRNKNSQEVALYHNLLNIAYARQMPVSQVIRHLCFVGIEQMLNNLTPEERVRYEERSNAVHP